MNKNKLQEQDEDNSRTLENKAEGTDQLMYGMPFIGEGSGDRRDRQYMLSLAEKVVSDIEEDELRRIEEEEPKVGFRKENAGNKKANRRSSNSIESEGRGDYDRQSYFYENGESTQFFDTRLWRRISKTLPNAVRDPLDFNELEKDEIQRNMNKREVESETSSSQQLYPMGLSLSKIIHQDGEWSTQGGGREKGTGRVIPGGLTERDWMYLQDHNLRNGGLPTLEQVLQKKTYAPLSFRDFAVHCSVRQPEARKWLEFYLAAVAHEKMCISYQKKKERGGRGSRENGRDEEYEDDRESNGERVGRKKTNASLSSEEKKNMMKEVLQIQGAAESIFLRYFRAALIPTGQTEWDETEKEGFGGGSKKKLASEMRRMFNRPIEFMSNALAVGGRPTVTLGPGGQDPNARFIHMNDRSKYMSEKQLPYGFGGGEFDRMGRQKSMYKSQVIYYMPWPPEILSKIELQLSRGNASLDPHLFSEAIMYAYEILDVYYFTVFVREGTSRNVTHAHCVIRVAFACLLLLFGFCYPLTLILSDASPIVNRLWCIIPLLVGWWNMGVGFSGADLLLSLTSKYQSPVPKTQSGKPGGGLGYRGASWKNAWFSTRNSIDRTATRMVYINSLKWFSVSMLFAVICCVILCSVPGRIIYTN
ncbi:hypothetical protein AX774_g2648 [Zancudomyces culisetae]|uniref:RGS domain-containing protein n=1 Tax=Zancudomyces culisetae TaxID=1213189 RepID=A0A1R1PSA5_ZANCU|nr:hypothetical protein AX774_g2648 [Zancudomyces culisetae]|eukprot:OMH83838.1 hypothetical protein AX774_g2648 [Zancudomyces culisetae]